MQFGNPVSHPPSPAALTLLCWDCTSRGKEWIHVGSFILVLPLSFLLASVYSIWKTQLFLSRSSLWLKTGRNWERERQRQRKERRKEHSSTILVSFPRPKAGNPSTNYILGLSPPLLHCQPLLEEPLTSPRSVWTALLVLAALDQSTTCCPSAPHHIIHPEALWVHSALLCVLRNDGKFFCWDENMSLQLCGHTCPFPSPARHTGGCHVLKEREWFCCPGRKNDFSAQRPEVRTAKESVLALRGLILPAQDLQWPPNWGVCKICTLKSRPSWMKMSD